MTVLGLSSPVARDGRMTYAHGGSETLPSVNSTFKSGYEFTVLAGSSDVTTNTPIPDIPFTTGVKVWFGFEERHGSFSGWAGASCGMALINSSVVLSSSPRIWVYISSATGDVHIQVQDANSGNSDIAGWTNPLGGTPHWYVLELERNSDTQMTVTLYEDGVTKIGPTAHNNAGGLGTITWKNFIAGSTGPSGATYPKGGTHTMGVGDCVVHDTTGSGAGAAIPTSTSRIQSTSLKVGVETGSHPTGMPDETDFRNTADSGSADVTEVDDPWGTVFTTRDDDFNQSLSNVDLKTQAYSFPSNQASFAAKEVMAVWFGGDFDNTPFVGTSGVYFVVMEELGVETELDLYLNSIYDLSGKGGYGRIFTTRPSNGGLLTQSDIDNANFKVRKKATGSAQQITLYTVDLYRYYEPGVAAPNFMLKAPRVPQPVPPIRYVERNRTIFTPQVVARLNYPQLRVPTPPKPFVYFPDRNKHPVEVAVARFNYPPLRIPIPPPKGKDFPWRNQYQGFYVAPAAPATQRRRGGNF